MPARYGVGNCRQCPCGYFCGMASSSGVADYGTGLFVAAVARWRAASGLVEPGESRHFRGYGAPAPWTATIHAPRCEEFGGFRESWTCRFRYQPYDNLIEDMNHTRAFAEINGALDNGMNYHLEGMWSEAEIPNWYTTPSYPPFPLTDTSIMEVAPNHPGRQAFCADYGTNPGDPYYEYCQGGENWYFQRSPVWQLGSRASFEPQLQHLPRGGFGKWRF